MLKSQVLKYKHIYQNTPTYAVPTPPPPPPSAFAAVVFQWLLQTKYELYKTFANIDIYSDTLWIDETTPVPDNILS